MIRTASRRRAAGLIAGLATYILGVAALGYPIFPSRSFLEPRVDDPLRIPILALALVVGLAVVSPRVRLSLVRIAAASVNFIHNELVVGPRQDKLRRMEAARGAWQQARDQEARAAHFERFAAEDEEARFRAEWQERNKGR